MSKSSVEHITEEELEYLKSLPPITDGNYSCAPGEKGKDTYEKFMYNNSPYFKEKPKSVSEIY